MAILLDDNGQLDRRLSPPTELNLIAGGKSYEAALGELVEPAERQAQKALERSLGHLSTIVAGFLYTPRL